jgi:hypothetical protein
MGSRNARKTHCAKGHPYDQANTYIDGLGRRVCRQCRRAYWNSWYRRTHGR